MKITYFATLMVALASHVNAVSVEGHHALDNFDNDALLFGETYNFSH
jgi:hypothetical protein